jgi:iron complex outermembrane receptor protein
MRAATQLLKSAAATASLVLLLQAGTVARAQSLEDLQHMSINDLVNVDVSSVTKQTQAVKDAPGAIYVITHDDITRSGATSIPEMLRLAPNLFVAQTSASGYTITARGFSGNQNAQSFSNKLLVLIDGRSVYTPLFSGVYWDMQDVPAENIERIEVISGPGATLWGANAFNGVINIITRKASETQGAFIDVGGGGLVQKETVELGGKLGDDLNYRLYGKAIYGADTVTATGAHADDHWTRPQGGVRFDWTPRDGDTITLQGDGFTGAHAQTGAPDETIAGANVISRWTHNWQDGSSLQAQAYYDHAQRGTQQGNGFFRVDTYDVDLQHSFALGRRNDIVWGGGLRVADYEIDGTASLFFVPATRKLVLADVFAQDSISITGNTKLILGLKLEEDPYSGLAVLPNLRFSWKPTAGSLIWASASEAIRTPTPFDRDVVEKFGPILALSGNTNFQPEKLNAIELGGRFQPTERASLSISTYHNEYNSIRTIEPFPGGFFPLTWGNGLRGNTYGVEAWGDYRLADWWRVTATINLMHEHLTFKSGASGIIGPSQAGDDPSAEASLRSSMNLGKAVTLDGDLRYVSALPNPRVPAYVELNARVGWNVTPRLQLSLTGSNLLHERHLELPAPAAYAVPRSVFAELRWRL